MNKVWGWRRREWGRHNATAHWQRGWEAPGVGATFMAPEKLLGTPHPRPFSHREKKEA
ncbi:MAG: hypothetical protein UZ16_OP3001002157 [Candidatus Hinthialibacteria bacterium OLB16]|nr:MAG: hypothetical protein UZ16_OP3001002157 [Candidatus Hinthialibacteria bacterium OLB16]